MNREVYSLCFMCSVRCPIKLLVKDCLVKWIEGNPHVAGMEGSLCPRGVQDSGKKSAGMKPYVWLLTG